MKFVISTQEMNYLINKCQNVVAQKTTVPILSNFMIEAVNDEIILTATDLTVGVRCFTDAKILEEGSTTLPARKLAQLARELTSIDVEISTNNDITEIKANTSRFRLNGMNTNEFPSLPQVTGAAHFKIPQATLKDLLFRTAFAVSKEDNRHVLTGLLMKIAEGKVHFTGTDGKRLAKAYAAVSIDPTFSGSFVVPLKAIDEISKNLLDEGDATIFLMNDKIGVEAANTMIVTKLLSGEYPDVGRVIPQNPPIAVVLHREELISLLRQISLFTIDTNHSVRFCFSEGELHLSANTIEIGEGKVSMPVNFAGAPLEIAFNPAFFLDILRHCKSETVILGITDAYNPGIIIDGGDTAAMANDPSPLFVLMPMRLNEE